MPLDSKHTETSLSPTSTDTLYLQITQVPRSQDLAIFVDDNDNNTTNLTLVCARRIKYDVDAHGQQNMKGGQVTRCSFHVLLQTCGTDKSLFKQAAH